MDIIIEALKEVDAGTFILWIIATIGIITGIITLSIKGYKLLEKYRKARNEADEKEQMLEKHETDIKELKDQVGNLDAKLDRLIEAFDSSEQASRKYRVTSLHDRIFQLHRICMEHKYISEDDLENFNKMTEEYLGNGGNGIVKKKIIPEVLNLPIHYNDSEIEL